MPRGFTEKWIIHLNELFENDREALYKAYRRCGDHESLGLGLKALGQKDYPLMKTYLSKMLSQPQIVRETTVTDHNAEEFYNDKKKEQEEFSDYVNNLERPSSTKELEKNSNIDIKHEDVLKVLRSNDKKDEPLQKSLECTSVHNIKKSGSVEPPVAKEPLIHSENVIIKEQLTVVLVESKDDCPCDPATCSSCKPIPYPDQPTISPGCVVIYAGPGSGKTESIRNIRRRYARRVSVWDTDHTTRDSKIPSKSLVFTNRPDIFSSYNTGVKIAFIPYRRHWIRQCLEKCPHAKDKWFDDMITNIRRSLVVRENCYLSDRVRFEM